MSRYAGRGGVADALLVDRACSPRCSRRWRARAPGPARRAARSARARARSPPRPSPRPAAASAGDVLPEREHADQQHEHGRRAPRGGVDEARRPPARRRWRAARGRAARAPPRPRRRARRPPRSANRRSAHGRQQDDARRARPRPSRRARRARRPARGSTPRARTRPRARGSARSRAPRASYPVLRSHGRPVPHPQLLDHRPHRPRQVDAGRSHPRDDADGRPARHARAAAGLDGPRARARDHDQGPGGARASTTARDGETYQFHLIDTPGPRRLHLRGLAARWPRARARCSSSTPPRASRRRPSPTPTSRSTPGSS